VSGACDILTEAASDGVAPALRAVDCLAGETVSSAFGRLFGQNGPQEGGALLPALTIVLTLYIAWFAFGLFTGRSRLGIASLTPRALTIGLVLTFATSWVAYSEVVWNLATGAPDEIASVITGSRGNSATQIFGDRVDLVFVAIADAADANKEAATPAVQQAQQGAQAASAAASGNFTPANVMWLGAILLLLGTVGVLVTARIALAVLMAIGPVFVVFALFDSTRGLFVGWLRGMVLTAVTPLFVVVGGGVVLELLVPLVASLRGVAGVDGRAALALFVVACVHCALMAMMLKVAGTTVSAWQVFGLADRRSDARDSGDMAAQIITAAAISPLQPAAVAATAGGRRPAPAASVEVLSASPSESPAGAHGASRTHITQIAGGSPAGLPPLARQRARGIGSRFAAPKAATRAGGMLR
jgi:type IV secretion system protein VirB6